MGEPQAMKVILERLASHSSWDVPQATERVGAVWARIAPVGLSSHCKVGSLVGGVLQLVSDAPLWAQETKMVASELVDRINRELGEPVVREIVVTLRRRSSGRG
ncbi:DUF721 domain-containing protein [Candidatus Fermentibacteria bacterium]|nr:DUF721 domain-containing protein [Candidatus Fermentibacteria bacterium]